MLYAGVLPGIMGDVPFSAVSLVAAPLFPSSQPERVESMQEGTLLLGILFGSMGTVCLNLGKGVQKMKVHIFTKGKAMFNAENRGDVGVWCIGLAMTTAASPLYSLALKMTDKASIVSSLGGVGLLALMLFAHYVLKERLGKLELSGGFLIIAGTVLMGLFDVELNQAQTYSAEGLFYSIATLVVFFGVLATYSYKTRKLHGVIFGSLAGALVGLAMIVADVALIRVNNDFVGQLATPYPYVALLVGAGALAVTQYAFLHSRAIVVVPSVNSFIILTPVLLEYFIFHTWLVPLQYLSVVVIVAGVFLLSCTSKEPEAEGA